MSAFKTIADWGFKLLEVFLVIILAAMVALVFTNVVMRYGFDTGITVTDELSRMMFVWISFLGAIIVARKNGHLGVDILTANLKGNAARICRVLTNVGIIACCWFLFTGAYPQTMINMANKSPISGIPTGAVYAAPLVASVVIAIIALFDLIAALTSDGSEPDTNSSQMDETK